MLIHQPVSMDPSPNHFYPFNSESLHNYHIKFIAPSLQQDHSSQSVLWSPGPTQFPKDPLCTFRNQYISLLQNRVLDSGAPSHFRGSSDPETGPCCTRSQLFAPSSLGKEGLLFLCSFNHLILKRFSHCTIPFSQDAVTPALLWLKEQCYLDYTSFFCSTDGKKIAPHLLAPGSCPSQPCLDLASWKTTFFPSGNIFNMLKKK